MNVAGLLATYSWLPLVAAMFLSLVGMPPYIKLLKRYQVEQYLREEGPKSHAGKAKTPTGGGVCFILAFTIVAVSAWVVLGAQNPHPLIVILCGLACGAVGFIDDLAKLRNKKNDGISAKKRLIAEFAIGAGLGLLLCLTMGDISVLIPGLALSGFVIGLIVAPFTAFLVAGTSNALNLHDGMDGLAAGTSSLVFATLAIMLFAKGEIGLASVAATACGALLGFLCFNKYPAKIFMGDTGSLFIGGLMAALVCAGGLVIFFIPLSLIYIAEALSVMLQVSYFKLTKPYTPEEPMRPLDLGIYKLTHRLPGDGKRLFRMAPLHHHFEAVLAEKGLREWQVVAAFWAVQLLLCALVLALYFSFSPQVMKP